MATPKTFVRQVIAKGVTALHPLLLVSACLLLKMVQIPSRHLMPPEDGFPRTGKGQRAALDRSAVSF